MITTKLSPFFTTNTASETWELPPGHCQTLTNLMVQGGVVKTIPPLATYTLTGETYTDPDANGSNVYLRRTRNAWYSIPGSYSLAEEYQDSNQKIYFFRNDSYIGYKQHGDDASSNINPNPLALYPPAVRNTAANNGDSQDHILLTATTVAASGSNPGGRMAATNADGEACSYKYVFTFVNYLGFESGPSDETDTVSMGASNNAVVLGSDSLYDAILPSHGCEAHIHYMRIYRINVGQTDVYQYVDQVEWGTSSYTDLKSDEELGGALATTGYRTIPTSYRFTGDFETGQVMLKVDTAAGSLNLKGAKNYLIFLVEYYNNNTAGDTSDDVVLNVALIDKPRRITSSADYRTRITFTKQPPYNVGSIYYRYVIFRLDDSDTATIQRKYFRVAALDHGDNLLESNADGTYSYYDESDLTTLTGQNHWLYTQDQYYRESEIITSPHNGMTFVAIGNRVYRSRVGNYSLYNQQYYNDFPGKVYAMSHLGGEMAVITDRGVSRLVGDTEDTIYPVPVEGSHASTSPYAVTTPYGVLYFTTQGHLALFDGNTTKAITEGMIAVGTITPGRMYYYNEIVYITQPQTSALNGQTWVVDFRQFPNLSYRLLDYTGSGYYIRDWWYDGTRLYALSTNSAGTGSFTIMKFSNDAYDPIRYSGAGPAVTLTTGEFCGEDPTHRKYFSRLLIDYTSDGVINLKVYKNGSASDILSYDLPSTSGVRNPRKIVKIPSGTYYRISFKFTTSAGTTATIHNVEIQHDELEV